MSDSLPPQRLYSPWNSPGQNTRLGSLPLLEGIFKTQGSNPGLQHCRWIPYQLSRREVQEYWSGQPIPSPEDLPDLGIKAGYPALQANSLSTKISEKSSGEEPSCRCRRLKRCGFNPWVGKIPWSRKWQPTPEFLPGESHGRRSLAGYSLWGCTESDTTELLPFCFLFSIDRIYALVTRLFASPSLLSCLFPIFMYSVLVYE